MADLIIDRDELRGLLYCTTCRKICLQTLIDEDVYRCRKGHENFPPSLGDHADWEMYGVARSKGHGANWK